MRLHINFGRMEHNSHGRNAHGQFATIHGWKLTAIDQVANLRKREVATRAIWYRRFILYFPSGAWWYVDAAIVRAA